MRYLLGLAALIAGLAAGDWFPDIDQKTGLLLHRSIVTHGPLVPLIVFAAASGTRSIQFRWFAMGVTLGVAIHLSFDLFPGSWSGFALISVPSYGWTASWFSWVWIAISTVACIYLALRLVRGVLEPVAPATANTARAPSSGIRPSETRMWRSSRLKVIDFS